MTTSSAPEVTDPQPGISRLVRVLLQARDESRAPLADYLGVSVVTLNNKLRNSRRFDTREVFQLARYFGVPVAAFYGDEDAVNEALREGVTNRPFSPFAALTSAFRLPQPSAA